MPVERRPKRTDRDSALPGDGKDSQEPDTGSEFVVRKKGKMPKLPPFALAEANPKKSKSIELRYGALCFAFLAALLVSLHLNQLTLPYFWDELGQFVPTALDLLRDGSWVAHSTLPNVHPPGVAVYLVLWYKLFGYSIAVTRVAMLMLAAGGVLLTFLLAIELTRDTERGAPAFLPPLFLLASPLFFTQSMMAQLDMPAAVFTLLALLLFLKKQWAWTVAACVLLVLMKETGLLVPAILGAERLWRRDLKRALWFAVPAVVLAGWLVLLHAKTGYWLGNPGFAHYNVGYALEPVRMFVALVRRLYYLFFAEFRWIGTAALLWTLRSLREFRSDAWRLTLVIAGANILLVSFLGGAELDRYLLPVLPLFYIAVSIAFNHLPKRTGMAAATVLLIALAGNLFWNPVYPFPFEDNYAMVDFVHLQQIAAAFSEHNFAGRTIATAWPYSAALRNPDFGFVTQGLKVVESGDFHTSSIDAIPERFDVLITYTRTWLPQGGIIRGGVLAIPGVKQLLSRFYNWEPAITQRECLARGLEPLAGWSIRGQQITIYARPPRNF